LICAIVLAAGQSRRMGRQKLLLPYRGKTIIRHIVDAILASRVDEIIVVTGHDKEKIIEELSDCPLRFVANPDPQGDMLSSVRCGLQSLSSPCRAILVAPGDHPGISTKLIDQILAAFQSSDKGILVPCHQHQRGHPLLFSARYRDEVMTCFDDKGLRGLLHAHPEEVMELNVSSPVILSNLNTPADYQNEINA
jgi:molybdenum cofactor cytidylyltransferase